MLWLMSAPDVGGSVTVESAPADVARLDNDEVARTDNPDLCDSPLNEF